MNQSTLDGHKENVSFINEIQMMMFGLGDSATPQFATAAIVEKVVLQQLITIIGKADEVAETRGVDGIYPQDILFLMRKDVHKLNRIVNYISFKDYLKKSISSIMSDGDLPTLTDNGLPTSQESSGESKKKVQCTQFLLKLGIDLQQVTAVDAVKLERLKRNDRRIQSMTQRAYEEYNLSRRTTFLGAVGRFEGAKFIEWIRTNCPDCPVHRLRLFSVDMLQYLAKETIAQLIDVVLLLRQDARVSPGDPFSRTHLPTLPFETFGPSNRQLEGPAAISPAEVQEALRRFYSTQLCPWGAFSACLDPAVYQRILACS